MKKKQNNTRRFKEKCYYQERIIELIGGVKSIDVLSYIYKIICKEIKEKEWHE